MIISNIVKYQHVNAKNKYFYVVKAIIISKNITSLLTFP